MTVAVFRSYKKELGELSEHLLSESFGMRRRYASAFLSAYGRRMAKRYGKATRMSESILASQSNLQQTTVALELVNLDIAFVAAAYQGYMGDLRRGRHVGTDVEKAIWAILDNRRDLLRDLDGGLAEYIGDQAEKRFPRLYSDVFGVDEHGRLG